MRIALLAALAAVALAGGAPAADERYDRRLAQAAAEIVAARMGPLRGGFAPGETPVLLAPAGTVDTGARSEVRTPPRQPPGAWQDGLAIAVERKPSGSPDL